MKNEFSIEDEWLPFEIHPDTPADGVLWKDYFPGMNPIAFWRQLNARAFPMGLEFGPQTLMSNSSKAMQAGEFVKAHGRYDAYHDAVFKAFFTDCKDIGDIHVILEIAKAVGLDEKRLETALNSEAYKPVLEETTVAARHSMITSAPTFVIAGYGTITGAEPIDNFRSVFEKLIQKKAQL